MPNALDLNLGNVKATPYVELHDASPLPPLTPSSQDLPSQVSTSLGAYTLKTYSLYNLFHLTLTF
ncbi:hypothetical protein F5877DRAFT_85386 [Lentinula edodes]|nr:hypothetical protein F5877DRAFT_85386 [Lentinula edodes]